MLLLNQRYRRSWMLDSKNVLAIPMTPMTPITQILWLPKGSQLSHIRISLPNLPPGVFQCSVVPKESSCATVDTQQCPSSSLHSLRHGECFVFFSKTYVEQNLTHKIHQNTIYSLILFVWLKGHFEIIRYTSIQFSHVCFPENDQIKTLHITYITIPKILDVGFLNRGWFRSSFCEPILCGFVRFKLQDTQIWMWNIWCAILVYIGLCWISILFKLPIQDWGRCAYLHCRWLNVHLKGLVWGSWGNGAGFPVAARWKRQIINRMEKNNQNICKCLLQTIRLHKVQALKWKNQR